MNVYIFKNGNRMGPYPLAEAQRLRDAGQIHDTDMAWYEGHADWIPLSQVPGFASASVPSAMPPVPPVQPRHDLSYPATPSRTGEAPTALRIITAVVVFGVLFVFLFVVIFMVAMVVGGAMSGAQAAAAQHAEGFHAGQAVGREAGRKFAEEYMGPIALGTFLASSLLSALLAWLTAFSELLPWCRRK